MSDNFNNCLICEKPLVYFNSEKKLTCEICKGEFFSNASCDDNHFICDVCHSEKAISIITDICLNSDSKNPIKLSDKIMVNKFIHMHGPEHHYLVSAVLLTAYKNSEKNFNSEDFNLEEFLHMARERAVKVPGGICGFWGSCGGGIATGIFISVLTQATPLSKEEWSLANAMTAESLKNIGKNGGPRCCKRNTYLSLETAIKFVKDNFNIEMEQSKNIICGYFNKNETCKKEECLYFPKKLVQN